MEPSTEEVSPLTEVLLPPQTESTTAGKVEARNGEALTSGAVETVQEKGEPLPD